MIAQISKKLKEWKKLLDDFLDKDTISPEPQHSIKDIYEIL